MRGPDPEPTCAPALGRCEPGHPCRPFPDRLSNGRVTAGPTRAVRRRLSARNSDAPATPRMTLALRRRPRTAGAPHGSLRSSTSYPQRREPRVRPSTQGRCEPAPLQPAPTQSQASSDDAASGSRRRILRARPRRRSHLETSVIFGFRDHQLGPTPGFAAPLSSWPDVAAAGCSARGILARISPTQVLGRLKRFGVALGVPSRGSDEPNDDQDTDGNEDETEENPSTHCTGSAATAPRGSDAGCEKASSPVVPVTRTRSCTSLVSHPPVSHRRQG